MKGLFRGVVALALGLTLAGAAPGETRPGAKALQGIWEATLRDGEDEFLLILKLKPEGDGLRATVGAPDFGRKDVPVEAAFRDGKLTVRAARPKKWALTATPSDDGTRLRGRFEQAGSSIRVTLRRVK